MKCVYAHYFKNRIMTYYLAFISVWLIGLILGIVLSVYTLADIRNVVYSLPQSKVSVFTLFFVNTIFLLVCAVLFQFTKPAYVLPVLFLKTFISAYCSQGIVFAYGNAGWLVRWLLTMSGSCGAVLLLLFCCLNFNKQGRQLFSNAVLTFAFIAILVCIDFYAVQPLCAVLLK